MLRRVNIWRCAVVVPSLLRRAVLLRWGLLALRWDSDTNMCVLADGSADGLPCSTRLEMYGEMVQLVKLHMGDSSVSSSEVSAITAAMESALVSLFGDLQANDGNVKRTIVARQMPPGNAREVIAEWSLAVQQQKQQQQQQQQQGVVEENSLPLMESGVVFPSRNAAGPRVLRAARQTFGLLVANKLRQYQAVCHTDPVAILDVSELDCSFSRVATLVAVERGMEPERQFHVSYVPLTDAAAATADADIASLLRLVAHLGNRTQPDPLRALQSRYFTLGSYTVCHSNSSSVKRSKGEESVGIQLAHVVSKMHRGGTLLVNILGEPPMRIEGESLGSSGGRGSDISLQVLRKRAKTFVTEALSRASRWGVINDEVLPAADLRGLAVSLVLSLDK